MGIEQKPYRPHSAASSSDIGANAVIGNAGYLSFIRPNTGRGLIGTSFATGLP
jgi:hypothetical protein